MFSSDVHFLSYTKVNANWVYKFNKKKIKKRPVPGGVEPPILRLTVARLNQLGHETC